MVFNLWIDSKRVEPNPNTCLQLDIHVARKKCIGDVFFFSVIFVCNLFYTDKY